MEVITDRPEARFSPGSVVHTADGTPLTVRRFDPTARAPLVIFEEVAGRDEAEQLRDTFLYISAEERRPLENGEFWPEDLVGMDVVSADGAALGRVADVEIGSGQDRLLIETASGTVTVPFVAELVPEVDPASGRIVVVLPEGLMD